MRANLNVYVGPYLVVSSAKSEHGTMKLFPSAVLEDNEGAFFSPEFIEGVEPGTTIWLPNQGGGEFVDATSAITSGPNEADSRASFLHCYKAAIAELKAYPAFGDVQVQFGIVPYTG